MDKKIVAVIIIVAVIAIILAMNFLQPAEPAQPDENTLLEDENVGAGPLDLLTPEEIAAYEQELQESDPVRYQALKESNVGICDQETDTAEIGWCKAAVAEKLKDESICLSLDSAPRNQCYNDVARATGKLELCRSIEQATWKFACITALASMNNNLEACNEITDQDYKDNCIAQIAMDRNDSSLCSQVMDELAKEDCIANITG